MTERNVQTNILQQRILSEHFQTAFEQTYEWTKTAKVV